ncbi:MAG: ADP-ribosylglycohydrolase family protein [Flavobacteriales bacterium]
MEGAVSIKEAALWFFFSTDNYRSAILAATNLGDDAETTAAIAGQIAGDEGRSST